MNGPANWPRAAVGDLVPPARAIAVKPTSVSDVQSTDSTVSFDVTRLGAPVLVKVPDFPNWQVSGATGPYEVSPNLMAVVPTAHHVILSYGTTGADQIGKLASLGGVVGLGMLMTLKPPDMGRPPPGEQPLVEEDEPTPEVDPDDEQALDQERSSSDEDPPDDDPDTPAPGPPPPLTEPGVPDVEAPGGPGQAPPAPGG